MNDLPSQTVLQQSNAKPMTGSELEVLGKKASAMYLSGGSPTLTEAVVETVKQAGISPEQVKRVAEFANTDAYLKEFEKKGSTHKYVDFQGGPANPSEILKDLNDGGGGTVFDRGDGDYSQPPTLGKTAEVLRQRNREAMEKVAEEYPSEVKGKRVGRIAGGLGGALLGGLAGQSVGSSPLERVGWGAGGAALGGLSGMVPGELLGGAVGSAAAIPEAMRRDAAKKAKEEEKAASIDFNPAETAFEEMFAVEEEPLPYAEPLADSIDMREKLASAADHFRAEIDQLEGHYQETVEDLYGQVKQAAMEGVPLGHVLQAWSLVVPGEGFVKVAFAHLGRRLMQDGVFSDVDEMGDSLEKTASGTVDTSHPLVSNFAAFCLDLEKLAEARAAHADVAQNLEEVTDFLKHAGKIEDLISAGGAIPKALRSAWSGAGKLGLKLKEPTGKALGALGGPTGQRVGEAVGEYGPKALLAGAGLAVGEGAYQRAVKHGPLGLGVGHLKARIPGTQEYYMRQMALSQNPGLL